MPGKRRRHPREKDLTSRYLSGDIDEDRIDSQERFSSRSAGAQQRKIERTALLRLAEQEAEVNVESLPVGQVVQVYSLYYDVEHQDTIRLCVVRKTVNKLLDSPIVVGDQVRFRDTGLTDEQGRPEAVIEQVLPRATILTRADSFKAIEQQPIVANAQQMLIVASLLEPEVRWGLIDRMIVAALSGGLQPILCLNKIDLASTHPRGPEEMRFASEALAHYQSLGIPSLQTSVPANVGLEELRQALKDRITVLVGHSGVGKSSLIHSIQPTLTLRIGVISGYTGKGRHTTTSAKRYDLDFGGQVIDTPGVKLFGLWNVSRENLPDFFPDLDDPSAPDWRRQSFQRILESLPVS